MTTTNQHPLIVWDENGYSVDAVLKDGDLVCIHLKSSGMDPNLPFGTFKGIEENREMGEGWENVILQVPARINHYEMRNTVETKIVRYMVKSISNVQVLVRSSYASVILFDVMARQCLLIEELKQKIEKANTALK